MPEMHELNTRLNDHEKRITKIEVDVGNMAPRIHVTELIGKLERQMVSLQESVRHSADSTEKSITKLAEDMSGVMRRLGQINEENMTRTAEVEREKHLADLALKDEQLRQMQKAAEENKFINRVKNYWTPIFVLVTAASGAAVVTWKVVSWFLTNL